jgi:hypothetical protein
MRTTLTRRGFAKTLLAGTASLGLLPALARGGNKEAFSFPVLGDLHFDKLGYHDLELLQQDKPDDLRQVREYSSLTSGMVPRLFATVRDTIAESNRSPETAVPFTVQVGDLIEGLCGSDEQSRQLDTDALAFVREARLGAPFLFTKGNHDITGPGAADAYDKESLGWLEAALAQRTGQHCFVVLHPPVVPYGARSTWHLFSGDRQKAQRDRLLELLGKHNAFVLSGHIHKYNLLVRSTPGGGRFLQLGVSSVIHSPEITASHQLSGKNSYNPDQVSVEPSFSPSTETQRRAVYETEAAFVQQFEYADLPGYAVVAVNGPRVTARVYSGITRRLWRTLELSGLLAA